jgi:hypothetical protein
MPVFQLQPAESRLDNPAWAVSWRCRQCYVIAENAAQARRYANGAFTIPLQSGTRVRDTTEEASCKLLPWSSDELVSVIEVSAASEFGPLGSIELELPRGDERVLERSGVIWSGQRDP